MASGRFFRYNPYDYYYTGSPYTYPSPYYHHQQPAPARRAGGFFQDADQYYGYHPEPAISRNSDGLFPSIGEFDPYYRPAPARRFVPAAVKVEPSAARSNAGASRPVSAIPVHSGAELEVTRVPVRRAPSAEEAAVRVQAAARGFLARRAVRALRALEREAEEIGEKVARDAAPLRADARARVAVGEQLMRLLFRLDAVHGAREYRKRVTRRVLALQDAVDALEQRPVDAAEEADEAEASGTTTVETVTAGLEGAVEEDGDSDGNAAAGDAADMEVDGNRVAAEDEEPAPGGADKPAAADEDAAEGEWEMLADEPAAAQSPATASGNLDAKKLLEMVAALCKQSAQQCAAIGALADRVDALERAVRRVEDAERRRQRPKKLKKEAKRSKHSKCYSD